MTVEVNGRPLEIEEPCTIAEMLLRAGVQEQRGVALALNDRVVPKARWSSERVNDRDRITVIVPAQGG